ncbi:MAG: hypothetical protein Ct9H90mP3_2250 [Flammeovirgaceae bacterium]|nr:MAG: hypothetical protein Ct9H90mP3_2250 [Flammeovirgaceae bacterium]
MRKKNTKRVLKGINETHLKANLKAVLYYSIYFPVMELFTSIGLGLLIWYGSNQLFSEEVTLGVLVAFIMYFSYFLDLSGQ